MASPYIIVRGAPGTGKSSVARALAARLPAAVAIETDALRRMISGVRWDDTAQHLDAIEVTATAAKSFRARGYQPIVVDTLGFGSLEVMLDALGAGDCVVFSLVCTPRTLRRRLFWRLSGYKDSERAVRFNQHVLDDLESRHTLFDTSRMSVRALASALADRLQ